MYRIERKVVDVRTFYLELYAKDHRECKIQFVQEEDLNEAANILESFIFPEKGMLSNLFLFTYS